MKHKHYEMIVAKAANMELVVFTKSLRWHEVDSDDYGFFSKQEQWFLCLPKHKEACLHWLNGGEIQDCYNDEWTKIKGHDGSPDWNEPDQLFMNEEFQLRIAPRKEKRWIAVDKDSWKVTRAYPSKQDCIDQVLFDAENLQFIEIEIEV